MVGSAGGETLETADGRVGPPVLVALTGILSLIVGVVLAFASGTTAHLLGYATGAIIPILVIGIARRVDLDRRTDPSYLAVGWFGTILIVLGVGAVVTAALHIWPLATEWAT